MRLLTASTAFRASGSRLLTASMELFTSTLRLFAPTLELLTARMALFASTAEFLTPKQKADRREANQPFSQKSKSKCDLNHILAAI
jgi:hypothetical protein